MLQDEKIPGVHIAFGHPYTEHTGADWSAKTHVDMVGRDFDMLVRRRADHGEGGATSPTARSRGTEAMDAELRCAFQQALNGPKLWPAARSATSSGG